MRSDLADANSQLMKIKEAERRKEIEEVKKIEAFAQKRETLENMKKEREEKSVYEGQQGEGVQLFAGPPMQWVGGGRE